MARRVSGWQTAIGGLPQRARRVIGVTSLLGLPGMYAWSAFWMSTKAPGFVWGPVSFVLILVSVGGAFVLYAFVRDRATFGADLDERQRQLRDRAWVMSYEVLSGVVVLAVIVLGVTVLGFGKVITLDGAAASGIVICVAVLVPLLPVAALAWVEPDAPPEA